jgi:DNA-binding response OmpR family regulator
MTNKTKAAAASVLVIDDEDDYRLIVREILSQAGYEVRVAGDGEEGLALLKRKRADVVLVDWMMPRMDGERFCRAMREEPGLKDIPVVMLTVRQTADEELEALHFGVDDFLVKPFKSDELLARVRAVLRRAANRRP